MPAPAARDLDAHWLHHSLATRWLQQLPMRHGQLLLGHDDIATTGESIDVDEKALRHGVQQVFG